jgi:hypothetical protein
VVAEADLSGERLDRGLRRALAGSHRGRPPIDMAGAGKTATIMQGLLARMT